MRVLVIYASDLAERSRVAPGGITGNVRSYLGALPPDWDVEVWGVDETSRPGTLRQLELGTRPVRFRTLLRAEPVADRRVPLSPRFCLALARFAGDHLLDGKSWDLLVTHRTEYHAALVLSRIAHALPPSVAMIHGSSAWSYTAMGAVRGFGQRLGERLAVRHASAVALVAGSTLPYYKRSYPWCTDRFVWVPNGVDLRRFRGADGSDWRRRMGFSDADRVLVYHGRYDREKGIARMLDVLRGLLETGARWHLVCAGSGPDGRLLADAAQSWGRGHVHDLGFLGRDDLPVVLAGVDLGLLLSDFEGLSNSLLEALAAGLPVVATDVGDNRLILETISSKLLVPTSIEETVGAVEWAWQHRFSLSLAARNVAERFSLEARIRRITELFSAVASGRAFRSLEHVV